MIKYGIAMIFLGISTVALIMLNQYEVAIIPLSVGMAVIAIEGLLEMYQKRGQDD